MRRQAVILIITSFFITGSVSGQDLVNRERGLGYLSIGTGFQIYKTGQFANPITQVSIPMSLTLTTNLNLSITHVAAASWQEGDRKIFGLSDTWFQTNMITWQDRLMLNAGIGLPTGTTRLDTNQYIMTKEYLSRNIYGFNLPVYGQGFSAKFGFALSIPLGRNVVAGIGAQYIYRQGYHPIYYTYQYRTQDGSIASDVWDLVYRPGNEISGQLGMDILSMDNLKISLNAMYMYYMRDMLGDNEIYGSGARFLGNAHIYYRYGYTSYLTFDILYRHQGKNEILQGLAFQQSDLKNGPQIQINFEAKIISDGRNGMSILTLLRYHKDTIFLQKNGAEKFDEFLIGPGVGGNYELTKNWEVEIKLHYNLGNLTEPRDDIIAGFDAFVMLHYTF